MNKCRKFLRYALELKRFLEAHLVGLAGVLMVFAGASGVFWLDNRPESCVAVVPSLESLAPLLVYATLVLGFVLVALDSLGFDMKGDSESE